jgi:hypothetical protein
MAKATKKSATRAKAATSKEDLDFLKLAATRFAFTGAKVQGGRLIPDPDYRLVRGTKRNTILLRRRAGGGPGVTIGCECGLEGGGCTLVIINPGDIDEYAVCIPESGCGKSGLFCFMDFGFAGGLKVRLAM